LVNLTGYTLWSARHHHDLRHQNDNESFNSKIPYVHEHEISPFPI
jgi:hypothetical protein